MSDRDNFLLGLIIGGLTGAAITYLFTTKSGEEIRKEISERSKEISKELMDVIQKKLEEINEVSAGSKGDTVKENTSEESIEKEEN
jgi:gas vesicle protein